MVSLKRIVLDVLKPHEPTIVELATELAERGADYEVRIRVIEMDDQTETLELMVAGEAVDLQQIEAAIAALGGSVHSVDEVLVGPAPDGG